MTDRPPVTARFARFELDEAEARLICDGQAVDIAPRAFQVLCELIRHAGQLVAKDALLDAVWGHRHVNEAALKNIVRQIRQALGDDAREAQYIETVARRGYRFIAPLKGAEAAPQAVAGAQEAQALVGRRAALAQLKEALQAARQGRRQLLFVVGEAGIGKSCLLEHFAASAPDVRLGFGPCAEHYGEAEPYLPVLEALSQLCQGDEVALALLRRVAPSWLLQLPWLLQEEERRELQRDAGATTQERMLREFGEFADRLSMERPLLLILEDLHWSDHATVQLLGYLARRRGSGALLLIGSFRPAELLLQEHPLAALRQELRPRRLCSEIDLEFLAETELSEWLNRLLGVAPPERFVQQLQAHTLGLPLFVSAVVDELRSAGKLGPTADGWRFPEAQELGVPRSVAGLIGSQIARLSGEQQRLLGAASVCGVEFLHLGLAEVLELTPEAVQALLEQISGRLPWLHSAGAQAFADGRLAARYRFDHAIYRQTLYDGLSELQRVQWHRRWAAALGGLPREATPELAAELALHHERGAAPAQAAAQWALVASRSMARGAPREALQAARHGLRLAAATRIEAALEQELRSLEAVALTREQVMAAPEVAEAFARARALGPVNAEAWQRSLQGCWWVHFMRAEYAQAQALAAEMLAQAERDGNAALGLAGRNAMGIALSLSGDFVAAKAQLEQALQAHAELDQTLPPTSFVQDPGVEAVLMLILVCWLSGEPRRARALAEQAVARAVHSRHPLSEATALYAASILHAMAGEFDTVFALTERLDRLVREQELPERRSGFAWLHGQALVARGEIEQGLAEMRAAAETTTRLGLRTGLAGFHYHHALACRTAARPAEAVAAVGEGLAFVEQAGERMLLAALLGLRAELAHEQGDALAASASWRQAIATAREQGAAFQEIQVLSSAQAAGDASAEPARLRELLRLYEGDPSPVIAAARAVAGA